MRRVTVDIGYVICMTCKYVIYVIYIDNLKLGMILVDSYQYVIWVAVSQVFKYRQFVL